MKRNLLKAMTLVLKYTPATFYFIILSSILFMLFSIYSAILARLDYLIFIITSVYT